MEAILILLGVGLALFIPVGSVLGFLAFRQRNMHSSRIETLGNEVSELRRELANLRRPVLPGEQASIEHLVEPDHLTPAQPPMPQPAFPPAEKEIVDGPPVEANDWLEVGTTARDYSRISQALKENWMVWLGASGACCQPVSGDCAQALVAVCCGGGLSPVHCSGNPSALAKQRYGAVVWYDGG